MKGTGSILQWARQHSLEETMEILLRGKILIFNSQGLTSTDPAFFIMLNMAYVYWSIEEERMLEEVRYVCGASSGKSSAGGSASDGGRSEECPVRNGGESRDLCTCRLPVINGNEYNQEKWYAVPLRAIIGKVAAKRGRSECDRPFCFLEHLYQHIHCFLSITALSAYFNTSSA